MSFTPIPENSQATPGLFNTRFAELDTTISSLTGSNGLQLNSTVTINATLNVISPAVTHNIDIQGGNLFIRQPGSGTTTGMQLYEAAAADPGIRGLFVQAANAGEGMGLSLLPGSQLTSNSSVQRNSQLLIYGVSGAAAERFGITYFNGGWTIDSTTPAGSSGITRPITFSTTGLEDVRLSSSGSLSIGTNGSNITERFGVNGMMRTHGLVLSGSTATVNLNQSRLLSLRTQPSLSSLNLAVDEIGFSLHASGASLALRSGGTIWYFTSSASTKG